MTRNVELCIADEQTYVGFEMLTEMQNLSILVFVSFTNPIDKMWGNSGLANTSRPAGSRKVC